MKKHSQFIGEIGEQFAMNYLEKNGFSILHHHFTTHWGELDIVAKKREKIFFIEVKTRVGDAKGKPYEAVSFYKIRSLRRAIQLYIQKHKLENYIFSLDVISIVLNEDYTVQSLQHFQLD